jgi:hypothetical protein
VKSEKLYARHRRAARPVVRRLLKNLGVWGLVPLITEIVVKQRDRRFRENPDDPMSSQLDLEQVLVGELHTLIEDHNHMHWPEKKKR